MSFSQRELPRRSSQVGASVLAALILVAILTLVAAAIQMTTPVSPQSQGAAAAGGAAGNPVVVGRDNTIEHKDDLDAACAKDKAKCTCQPGFDIYVMQQKGESPTTEYWEVCSGAAGPMRDENKPLERSAFGTNAGRCEQVDGVWVPKRNQAWLCKKVWCVPPEIQILPSSGAGSQRSVGVWKGQNSGNEVCWDVNNSTSGSTVNTNSVQGEGIAQVVPFLNAADRNTAKTQLDLGSDSQLNSIFSSAYDPKFPLTYESQRLTTEVEKLNTANTDAIKALGECTKLSGPSGCPDESAAADTAKKELDQAKKDLSANQAELAKLASEKTGLQGPCPSGAPIDASGGCSGSNTGQNCGAGKSFDPITKSCLPSLPGGTGGTGGGNGTGGTGGGAGGNPFGNPGMGANNGPQSPFGGACNNRYVCSGNTLYYQTMNSFGGVSAQCSTQPIQQCQFGCQPTAAQSQQTSGTQNTLQTMIAGLQVVSAISNLFGGSNNNSSATTNNLPSACATQQQAQQAQAPYGTGTNGQACTQPPQQPSAASCTSGTWKATSGTNNGCTTGWQCVPDATGSTSGNTPTAQLSCEPKIADAGMYVGFSFSCGNATDSVGGGFDTDNALSGSSTALISTPPTPVATATYMLTCKNQGQTASAQCQVQVSKPSIIMVTNPQKVHSGETATIGWITTGMRSCIISSPDQSAFTQANLNNDNINGSATTLAITASTTQFVLDCVTNGYDTRQATSSILLF